MASNALTITRTFSAPITKVWNAWADQDQIASWWGPADMPVTINEHDFQPSGQWQYEMTMPDGNPFISEGTYLKISEPNQIITVADFKPMTEGVTLQIDLEEQGHQTLFSFTVSHSSEEYMASQQEMGFEKGWNMVFDNLEKYLS